jgi:hypothetical protein
MMGTVFLEVTPYGLADIYRFFYLEYYIAYHGLWAGGRG